MRLSKTIPLNQDRRFRAHLFAVGGPVRARIYCSVRSNLRGNNVHKRTELVLEGFPRSANTYAYAAFIRANPSRVVAHHLHSPASIKAGVDDSIPTIVLVRTPLEACASLILRQGLTPIGALDAYIDFYSHVLPLLDRCTVSDFPATIGHFGAVIRRVNSKFGTSFAEYTKTEDNENWCRDFVVAADFADPGRDGGQTVGVPDEGRTQQAEQVKALLSRNGMRLKQAEILYDLIRVRNGI